MKEFGNIYLAWRKGSGCKRHIVGTIKSNATKGVRFSYNPDAIEEAKNDGFEPYTEFPDVGKEYSGNVLEVFGQRIIRSERSDIGDFLSFWEIDKRKIDDKLYMLAHTQGMSTSDNFEFLADFNPFEGLRFTTELAGLTSKQLAPSTLIKGDVLTYKKRPSKYDEYAVEVYKNANHIGYIKRVHSRVFYKTAHKLQIVVKSAEKNGVLKRVFLCVSSE